MLRRLPPAAAVVLFAMLLAGEVAGAQAPTEPIRMEPPPQPWVEALLADAAERIWRQLLLTLVEPFADLHRTLAEDAILVQTPARWTYAHPLTLRFHAALRDTATAAVALVLLVAAVNIPLRRRLADHTTTPGEALAHLLAGLAAVWTCLPPWGDGWAAALIELTNALIRALPEPRPAFDQLMAPVAAPALLLTGYGWLAALLGLLMGVGFVLYALVVAARLVVLDVLLAAAPLFLLCWVLPQTRGWAGLWARALVLTLILQPVQVLILGIAVGTLAPLWAGQNQELLAPLVGLATLYLLLKAPELLGGPVAGPTSLSRAAALPLRLARLARGRR
jgi:hypothetical protein